jgi:hypothetical protein
LVVDSIVIAPVVPYTGVTIVSTLGVTMSSALLEFTSHINGKNAKVQVFPDRLEWSRAGLSGGKMLAGVATMGLSMLATGVRNKDTEMIPIRAITSVTSKKGMANTTVSVITSGNTIDFKIGHSEASKLKATLLQLMAGV